MHRADPSPRSPLSSLPPEHSSEPQVVSLRMQQYADFASNNQNQGQIFEAPNGLWGHSLQIIFGNKSVSRRDDLLKNLRGTFGKEIVDQALSEKDVALTDGDQTLTSRALTSGVNYLLKTVIPTVNPTLKGITIDLSIPDTEAESKEKERLHQGTKLGDEFLAQVESITTLIQDPVEIMRRPIQQAVKETKHALNENLKNVKVNVSIPEVKPPHNDIFSYENIKGLIEKTQTTFSTYITTITHAANSAKVIQGSLQEMASSFPPILEQKTLQELTNKVTATWSDAIEMSDYAADISSTLKLENPVTENNLTRLLDQTADSISTNLHQSFISYKEAQKIATSLKNIAAVPSYQGLVGSLDFIDQNLENATTSLQKAAIHAAEIATIATKTAARLQTACSHSSALPNNTPSLQTSLDDLKRNLLEKTSFFVSSYTTVNHSAELLQEKKREILTSAKEKVSTAQNKYDAARKNIIPLSSSHTENFAARNLHREKTQQQQAIIETAHAALEQAQKEELHLTSFFAE